MKHHPAFRATIAAQRHGGPFTQAAIDSMWGGIVAKLNKAVSARVQPDLTPTPRPAPRALRSQTEVDNMWGSIATELNAAAGLASPSRFP
jgi:hypothetical protein